VVKDNAGGTTGFMNLGNLGTTVANTTTPFSPGGSGGLPPTLGFERVGSDLAIAVDPRNANHVYVAYVSVDPRTAQNLTVHVAESTNGGTTFNEVFNTNIFGVQAAQPAIAVDAKGDVGLLFNFFQSGNILGTAFTFTPNDFATTPTSILAEFLNGHPAPQFNPYLGDFNDLTSLGNTFFGGFASTNLADAINGFFPQGVTFQRSFSGTVNTPSFALNDGMGHSVAGSIDPYFFRFNVVPEPASLTLAGLGTMALAGYAWRRRRRARV
jgi:hypothetical protein